jgi:hypothetical protein
VEHGIDVLRGNETRTMWINRAITLEIIRKLLDKPFSFTDEEHAEAVRHARKLGIDLP